MIIIFRISRSRIVISSLSSDDYHFPDTYEGFASYRRLHIPDIKVSHHHRCHCFLFLHILNVIIAIIVNIILNVITTKNITIYFQPHHEYIFSLMCEETQSRLASALLGRLHHFT